MQHSPSTALHLRCHRRWCNQRSERWEQFTSHLQHSTSRHITHNTAYQHINNQHIVHANTALTCSWPAKHRRSRGWRSYCANRNKYVALLHPLSLSKDAIVIISRARVSQLQFTTPLSATVCHIQPATRQETGDTRRIILRGWMSQNCQQQRRSWPQRRPSAVCASAVVTRSPLSAHLIIKHPRPYQHH